MAITVESIHYGVGMYRRRKFITRLRHFFIELNEKIKKVKGSDDGMITRPMAQFAFFTSGLDDVKITIFAYQTHLKAKELSEIQEIINQENRLIKILPKNKIYTDNLYAEFFKRLQKLKWLKLQ